MDMCDLLLCFFQLTSCFSPLSLYSILIALGTLQCQMLPCLRTFAHASSVLECSSSCYGRDSFSQLFQAVLNSPDKPFLPVC